VEIALLQERIECFNSCRDEQDSRLSAGGRQGDPAIAEFDDDQQEVTAVFINER
jgi:hypothetical protein